MRLRITLIVSLLWMGISFQNCCRCDDVDEYFDIQDMSLSFMEDYHTPFIEGDTILDFDSLSYVRVNFDVDYISSLENTFFSDFNFMGKLYGCSCLWPGDSGSKEEVIEGITIITLNDYNEEFSAGDTINEIFWISPQWRLDRFVDMDEHIEADSSLVHNEFIMLKSFVAPTVDSIIQFVISIELSTDEVHTAISPRLAIGE